MISELNAAIKQMWMHYNATQVETLVRIIRDAYNDGDAEYQVIEYIADNQWFLAENPEQRFAVEEYVALVYAA